MLLLINAEIGRHFGIKMPPLVRLAFVQDEIEADPGERIPVTKIRIKWRRHTDPLFFASRPPPLTMSGNSGKVSSPYSQVQMA